MFVWPSLALTKAIVAPSGDQIGSLSAAESLVRFVWPLPSGFIDQISRLVAELL
jgi:hypothetical protein